MGNFKIKFKKIKSKVKYLLSLSLKVEYLFWRKRLWSKPSLVARTLAKVLKTFTKDSAKVRGSSKEGRKHKKGEKTPNRGGAIQYWRALLNKGATLNLEASP